jgi:hypothetical protein
VAISTTQPKQLTQPIVGGGTAMISVLAGSAVLVVNEHWTAYERADLLITKCNCHGTE